MTCVRSSREVLGVVGHLPVPTYFLAVQLVCDAASTLSSPRMGPMGQLLVLLPQLAQSPCDFPLDELRRESSFARKKKWAKEDSVSVDVLDGDQGLKISITY